eukprot:COSAG02_NODE_6759_length_3377_cov_4.664735_2_plen_170_part_00
MTGSRADCLLSGLFGSPGLIKLGQGFTDDLRLLKRGYPSWQAWKLMRNLVDVPLVYQCVQESAKRLAKERQRSDSVTAYVGDDAGWNRPRKHRRAMSPSSVLASTPQPTGKPHGVSLAKLCCYALGRPMDKAMQLSDWSMRPLSAAQQQYILLPIMIRLALRESRCRSG